MTENREVMPEPTQNIGPQENYSEQNSVIDVHTKPKKNKSFKKTAIAAGIIFCFFLSAMFGFGGGYFAAKLTDSETEQTNQNKVLYQSVIQTSDKQNQAALTPVSQVASAVASSVVEITTETVVNGGRLNQYVTKGAGSGVIITTDGYIVTNNHVIEDANKITVRLNNGKEYSAKLIGTDVKTDIAVIKINVSDLTPAVLGDSGKLVVGELAVAVGNPLGELGGTVTDGIISALDRLVNIDGETMTLLQTSAAINPGNSGGGLFNSNGELIGIVNAKSSGSEIEGLGFAIPVNTAKPIIEQLLTNGYVKGRIDLQMELIEILDAQTAMAYRVQSYGVYIASIEKNSNASEAGFEPGDLILKADDTEIATRADLNRVLDTHKVGEQVTITVQRSRSQKTFTLTLVEEKPDSTQY